MKKKKEKVFVSLGEGCGQEGEKRQNSKKNLRRVRESACPVMKKEREGPRPNMTKQ